MAREENGNFQVWPSMGPDVWLGLQADYDLYKARLKSKKAIDEIKPLAKKKAA